VTRLAIADHRDPDDTVTNKTFADCEVIGPVQLVPLGTDNQFFDCEFAYSPDNMAQMHPGGGPVVFLNGCTFTRCRFAMDVDAFRVQDLSRATD